MTSDPQLASANLDVLVIVAAHNEAERIAATLAGLAEAFPGAPIWVADDGSSDGTGAIAQAADAQVVRSERVIGKGGAVTLAARKALQSEAVSPTTVVVLCDGDLEDSARRLRPLVYAVHEGTCELAVARFSKRVGGGLGLAVGFARWAIHRRCGFEAQAPISGQRALRAEVLASVLPFAPGYGMEVGMTIDAVLAHGRVREAELDLHHRATGRTLQGFLHRGHQLFDIARAYRQRG